jgi:radical SAM superfamily enzyme YgiQ (UPF0313 family)
MNNDNNTQSVFSTKIALIFPPLWHYYFPPLSTPLLSAILRREGFAVDQYDLNIELLKKYNYSNLTLNEDIIETYRHQDQSTSNTQFNQYLETFSDRLCTSRPDIVGITFFRETVLSGLLVAKKIKERDPEILTIGGGQYFSIVRNDVQSILRHIPWLDIVVCGEGELVLSEIARKYEQISEGKSIDHIIKNLEGTPNVYSATFSPSQINADYLLKTLDPLPVPDFDGLPLDDYVTSVLPVSWSRGCPMGCTFCDYHYNTFGTRDTEHHLKFRMRSPDNCISDLTHLISKYNIRGFFICDNLINGNVTHLEHICQHIIDEGLDITWVALARIFPLTDQSKTLYELMGKAGCRLLIYGIESACQSTLDRMNKKIKKSWIKQNLIWAQKAGINVNSQWIIGFPKETYEDLRETIDFILDNKELVGDVSLNPFSLETGSLISLVPDQYNITIEGIQSFPSEEKLKTGSLDFVNKGGIPRNQAASMKSWLGIYFFKMGVLSSASLYLHAMRDFIKEEMKEKLDLERMLKKKREVLLLKILKNAHSVKSSFNGVFPEKDLQIIFES